ncbi:MAG: transcriptional [Beijerinckiaceae bacterium]|nr:MAG: transcriptional [Beijerinckiaceae bacterium]
MPLEAIEPRRLYRQVADQLRTYIDSGAIAVGGRMPTERELAERLGVSRPTIREALIALEVEGRIRIRVGSGIYVSEPPSVVSIVRNEHEGPFELLQARSFIEGAIAAEAAGRIQPHHLEGLDGILKRMEAAVQPSDEAIALDCEFHAAIAAILGNAVIERCVRDLFNQRMSPYFGRLAAYFEDEESWKAALLEHRAIRNALAARDPTLARDALRRHLQRSQDRFSRSFGDTDGDADEPDPSSEKSSRSAVDRVQ